MRCNVPFTTKPPTIDLDDRTYVVLPEEQYEDLLARAAGVTLPPYPPADADGNVPAFDYGRASVAREVILRRSAGGWSQQQLAEAAGVRLDSIVKLESAQQVPDEATMAKLEHVLDNSAASSSKPA
jgi:DNA-binding XRE family transcriptional regulator